MSELVKATLQEITSDENATPVGNPIPVQFNPSSLRLQITNNSAGGNTRGSQVRQHLGTSSTTLTLELVFDTADEGDTNAPRSVREKTDLVQKFVMPRGQQQDKQAPPKLRFQWGSLIVKGVVDSINIDLDHFAADGTPLRAKVGLTIREQDTRYQFLQSGAGANQQGANAPAPGQPAASAPGALGGGVPAGLSAGFSAGLSASASFGMAAQLGASAQFGVAIGGESAAEMAARVGVDPAAWRALATGSSGNSLSLEAGTEIGFSANLSASAGLGVSSGVGVGASSSLEASLGLEKSAGVTAVAGVGARAETAAGFALSAAGGVSAAVKTVQVVKSQRAEEQARQAFAAPSPAARNANTNAAATPSSASSSASATNAVASRNVGSSTFGFGVPLRPTVGAAANLRAGYLQGSVPLRSQTKASGDPPATDDPTTPPWVSLPAASRERDAADKLQRARSCGCRTPCSHRRRKK